MSNPKICKWTGCRHQRWAPYSRLYCPWHFANNAARIDRERDDQDLPPIARAWVRDRLCGVLNGYTRNLGDVHWKTKWPKDDLIQIAQDLGMAIDSTKEGQWRQLQAEAAERYPKKWDRYDRSVPLDYEGPGARVVAKTNREGRNINASFEGYSL